MQFIKPTNEELKQLVPDGTFLLGYRGSISIGTYEDPGTEFSTDDKDLMGVAIAPIECYFGLGNFLGKRSTFERFIGPWGSVTYELRKYVSLLCNANPNVLALLWLEPNFYISRNATADLLIESRSLFATKRIFHSFTGYVHGQIHRMMHSACEGYMREKRKSLVERFGYDTKNAVHAIRLLRMGIEFLNEGELYVYRRDRQQLLDIKHGEWSLELIKLEADRLFKRAEEAYDRCKLPDGPDMEKVNSLLIRMIRSAHTSALEGLAI